MKLSTPRNGRSPVPPLVAGGLITLAATVAAASAFSGDEHRTIGNAALTLATDTLAGTSISPQQCEIVRSVANDLREMGAPFSYGDLVALVDYVTDPTSFLQRLGEAKGFPLGPAALNVQHLLDSYANDFGKLRAFRNNNAHFQGHVMAASWFWHMAAVQVASSAYAGGEHPADCGAPTPPDVTHCPPGTCPSDDSPRAALFTALVLNAFADHFLMDFFAPGHITTSRETMGDLSSGGLHDKVNIDGREFIVRNLGDLDTLAETMKTADSFPLLEGRPEKTLGKIHDGDTLRFHGDGKLKKTPEQVVFMGLVVGRSVLDVLDSFRCGTPVNHFQEYRWEPFREAHDVMWKPEGEIHFGQYVKEEQPKGKMGVWILGGTLGPQAFWSDGNEAVRVLSELEVAPMVGVPGRQGPAGNRVPKRAEIGATFGPSFVFDQDGNARGGVARAFVSVTDLDALWSVAVHYRWFAMDREEEWKAAYEIRYDKTFGPIFVHLGLNYDHRWDDDGELKDGLAFRTGASFVFPTTWLRRLSK